MGCIGLSSEGEISKNAATTASFSPLLMTSPAALSKGKAECVYDDGFARSVSL